jgi:hypothetical protein
MVARKPAIKRGSVPPGALCCNVRALRCHVRALRCHVRPSGRLPDRLHDPRLAKDVKSCLPIARTSRTWSSRMTFASPKSLCYNEFCRPNDLDDERGLLRLQGNFRGGSALIIHFPTLMAYSARPGCNVTFLPLANVKAGFAICRSASCLGWIWAVEQRPRGRRVTRARALGLWIPSLTRMAAAGLTEEMR